MNSVKTVQYSTDYKFYYKGQEGCFLVDACIPVIFTKGVISSFQCFTLMVSCGKLCVANRNIHHLLQFEEYYLTLTALIPFRFEICV